MNILKESTGSFPNLCAPSQSANIKAASPLGLGPEASAALPDFA